VITLGVIMCAFCFGAAEAIATAEDVHVRSMRGGPAPDKDRDVTMTAKPVGLAGRLPLPVREVLQR
jgi:protein-disulfide isomerase-like protein with CxxC motif